MIQKKVCLLGSHSVGKTCLVRQYVNSIYDDNYLKTIGARVDKKILRVGETDLMLMIWDLAGEDDYRAIRKSYLRGAAACIIVVDGSRLQSAKVAQQHYEYIKRQHDDIAVLVAINRSDVESEWEVDEKKLRRHFADGETVVVKTCAKSAESVETLFQTVVLKILDTEGGSTVVK